MTDYRAMFDRDYIKSFDLDGRDATVTIAKVVAGELVSEGNKKSRAPILSFEGKDKRFVCNKTNGKIIAGMYGPKVAAWVGKRITLFPTTTKFGRDTVECIRVRPTIPSGKGERSAPEPSPPPAAPDQEPFEPGSMG